MEASNAKVCVGGVGLAIVEADTTRSGRLIRDYINMGLRAISAGMPSDIGILSDGGVLSLETVRKHDATFAIAITVGLGWKNLKWEVRERFSE